MKEYKLIKKYPSLPINWEEGMLVGQGDRQNGTYTPCNGKYEDEGRPFCLPLSEVWDNPEYWEKVIEKDYEILSIIGTNKHPLPKTILYLKDVYKKDFTGHLNDESNCWQIHSVKRLSDGEVFTVDDNTNGGTILKFELYWEHLMVKTIGGLCKFDSHLCLKKQPLFTTEDGVDICKGDSYCRVNNESDYSLVRGFISEGAHDSYKGLKFSTEEAAEEYILMNKPCLSINDVINNYHYTPSSIKHRLTELIKSRIFWKNN